MKDKIFESSIKLFGEKGFSETSIQDIVNSIGVTKGTFYYYFNSKEEILMEIQLHYIEDILATQAAILDDPVKTCKEKLYGVILMLLKRIETQGLSAKVFFREMRNLTEEHLAQIHPKRDLVRIRVTKLIEKGIETGEFRSDLNVPIVTLAILGLTNWSYEWYRRSGKYSEEDVATIYLDMILNGIKA